MSKKYPSFIMSTAGIILVLFILHARGNKTIDSIWPNMNKDISNSQVQGFGILYRIPGLWNGPVTSDTPAGNFEKWYVDFRPVSASQISQFSTVDPSMCNFVTFFIVKYGDNLKVAMRTDAFFQNKGCITYEVLQEADEEKGYYKFTDFQSGEQRAYTIFQFIDDELEMRVYTNKFNKLKELTLHSQWNARRVTMDYAVDAIKDLKYPQPSMVKDFSTVFGNIHESIFFERDQDPYPSKDEPYVGSAEFHISIDKKLKTTPDDELFIMLTTKPILKKIKFLPERLEYLSKTIYLPVNTKKFTLTHIHPGTYYLYSYNDVNHDRKHTKGDYMSSKFVHKIIIKPEKTTKVKTHIDFVMPK